MQVKLPSAGRILQFVLALGATLVAAIPFYRGAAGSLPTTWFFLAIVTGVLVGHPWAFILAPVPFLLGANLGRRVQGPQPPGYEIYPGYEFDLMMAVMAIMGAVGILLGILLRRWIGARAWSRAGPAGAVIVVLAALWGIGLYRELYPPTVTFTHADDPGGFMMELRAIGAQGTSAHTQSAPPAARVVQEGQAQVCARPNARYTAPLYHPGPAVQARGSGSH